jgi:hypothetical protein
MYQKGWVKRLQLRSGSHTKIPNVLPERPEKAIENGLKLSKD